MELEVRTVDASELVGWIACMDTGFLNQRADREEYARYYLGEVDLDRSWGAFDSETVVGTLRSFPTTLTVPGAGQVTTSAVTNVTVLPTHRRRGLLTRMISGDLASSVERGEALAILIASEYPIYGRFGFGPAAESASYTVNAQTLRFREAAPLVRATGSGPIGASSGEPQSAEPTVELVDSTTMRKEAPALYEAFRLRQPGAIGRDDRWWDRQLRQVEVPGSEPSKAYLALCRASSGVLEGYLWYEAAPNWRDMRPAGTVTIDELLALTPASYRRLWRYCCEVDLVSTVNASDRTVQEALPWMLVDGRAVRQGARFDFLWVRILDVCEALSSRCYATDGTLVLEVVDELGWASGTYLLEGGPKGASCTKSTRSPDLTLPVDALGAAYLGGFPFRVVAEGRGVHEHRSGAVGETDAMFRSESIPWCTTWF